ncbi:hypothetical protein ACQCLI_13100 [Pseudomonas nitroreducens]|uniref:hypothetical protein n=1 Tax=Pseudomonas nitroreducens TaxID=46680 RepID=UPI0002EEA5E1|nr:hypothetical protein [Pseudomonas nitroreducens]
MTTKNLTRCIEDALDGACRDVDSIEEMAAIIATAVSESLQWVECTTADDDARVLMPSPELQELYEAARTGDEATLTVSAKALREAMQARPPATPVATLLPGDPDDERNGLWLDRKDTARMAQLPAGTRLYTQHPAATPTGQILDQIHLERARQVAVEGWTLAHDAEHDGGQLADAAGCLALWAAGQPSELWRVMWPWDSQWLKPSSPRRLLIKAGALIVAELERLDRCAEFGVPTPSMVRDL